MGGTGTGKSSSAENLDSKQTYLINCAHKPLPFAGSGEKYKAGVNMSETDQASAIVPVLKAIDSAPEAAHIRNVIIDDSGFVMTELYFKKISEKGYDKFTEIAKAFQSILSTCKSMRTDLNIAIMMHDENLVSNGVVVERKAKTVGKLVAENLPVYA